MSGLEEDKFEKKMWADYEEDEPLPEVVFGVKMNSSCKNEEWTQVKKKNKTSNKKYNNKKK